MTTQDLILKNLLANIKKDIDRLPSTSPITQAIIQFTNAFLEICNSLTSVASPSSEKTASTKRIIPIEDPQPKRTSKIAAILNNLPKSPIPESCPPKKRTLPPRDPVTGRFMKRK